jgi:hypothetical protein
MSMGDVAGRRMTADIEGDFVVFLIGARFNNKLQLGRSLLDLGGRGGMKHMLDHLVALPPHELGKAGRLVAASESSSARARLKALSV